MYSVCARGFQVGNAPWRSFLDHHSAVQLGRYNNLKKS
jgi:hypothetical protein